MATFPPVQTVVVNTTPASSKVPFYRLLWVQVLVAMGLAIVLGYVDPARAVAMKPLGDAFIRLITMIITLIIFCTVVTGIAGTLVFGAHRQLAMLDRRSAGFLVASGVATGI
jgi:Na+/H+-dicarboxylate symporter